MSNVIRWDHPQLGKCAKRVVTCTIVALDGRRAIGENFCRRPQHVCPRAEGEGYEKCRTVCDQMGHAETVAIGLAKDAGIELDGAAAYVEGHNHYCRECQLALFRAGVLTLARPDSGVPE